MRQAKRQERRTSAAKQTETERTTGWHRQAVSNSEGDTEGASCDMEKEEPEERAIRGRAEGASELLCYASSHFYVQRRWLFLFIEQQRWLLQE